MEDARWTGRLNEVTDQEKWRSPAWQLPVGRSSVQMSAESERQNAGYASEV